MNTLLKNPGSIFTKLKIPTYVGLGIIIIGIGAGVTLVLQQQSLTTLASPAMQPINIAIGSIDDTSATITWQTNSASPGFLTFGPTGSEQTVLDIHDSSQILPRVDHFVKITNLVPKTTYKYRLVSGKLTSETQQFTTAPSTLQQNQTPPIIGSVLDSGTTVKEGIVFLQIPGATIQAAPISTLGSFTIPLTKVYKDDLSDILPMTQDTLVTLKIISGQNSATATFPLKAAQTPLSPINLGENITLTAPTPTPFKDLDLVKYDLNDDGQINAADWGIVLQNFGNSPKNKRADITGPAGKPDGVVDQKDLDAITQKIKERGGSVPTL